MKYPCEECALKEVDIDDLKARVCHLENALKSIAESNSYNGKEYNFAQDCECDDLAKKALEYE